MFLHDGFVHVENTKDSLAIFCFLNSILFYEELKDAFTTVFLVKNVFFFCFQPEDE
jgi:hypothetical protein